MSAKRNLPVSRDLLLLLLVWCGVAAFVNPIGDFPLNDDWAYGQNARALAVENRLFFSDWPAMTLIAHTLWGALFCKIFGFSFTVLRFSTLMMGAFGLIGFHRLLTCAGFSRQIAWWSSLLLVFNPLWFVSAFSYMTDVPFVAVLVWATLFFLKMLEKPALPTLLAATFFALWACFIRQLGLLAPAVFLLLFLYNQPINWRNIAYALFPSAVCFIATEAFKSWLEKTEQLPLAYRGIGDLWQHFLNNKEAFAEAVQHTGLALMTVGLFLLPLTISTLRKLAANRKFSAWWLLLLPGAYCVWSAWPMFPVGNVFFNLGLGPKLLKDAYWDINADPKLSGIWLISLKGMSAAGAGLLLLSLRQANKISERQRYLRTFSIGFCIFYLMFVGVSFFVIDRYLFVFVPFVIFVIGVTMERFTVPGKIGLAVFMLFSIAATHDYLAWNRARWQAIQTLERQGVRPEQMDGGFEFNGNYMPSTASTRDRNLKSWWFVRDDEWVVSFGSLWGYDAVSVVPYQRWLPPGLDSITINRRKAYTVRDSLWCDMERLSADSTAFLPSAGDWQPGNGNTRSAERARQGQYSMKLSPSAQFGATMPLDTFRIYDRLIVSVWRYPVNAEAGFVIAGENPEKAYFFEPSNIVERDSAGWGLLELALTMPPSAVGGKGSFYIWNSSAAQTVWFDELKVYRLQVK